MMFEIVMVRVVALVLWTPLLFGLVAQFFFNVPTPPLGDAQADWITVENEPLPGDPHWEAVRDVPWSDVKPRRTTSG